MGAIQIYIDDDYDDDDVDLECLNKIGETRMDFYGCPPKPQSLAAADAITIG